MSVALTKGANADLSRSAPGLATVEVRLGWDVSVSGTDVDLDASALLVGADGKVPDDQHFVFFNNLTSPDGSVVHLGDNRTGAGDGNDEVITIDLPKVPAHVQKIVFAVSIYEPDARGQSFGQVTNAYIRVVNAASGAEMVRYDLTEVYDSETALVFGEVYRKDEQWKFRAVGQGFDSGLAGIAEEFGVAL